ncbi:MULTISPECIES: integration host factor subunit alpha [Candidatus Ichthyocystis]|uniref:Integration host factor subunit alpha n=2 Tax=Candidatus Ichthyocystis hellenicum TaxID=1561003 RepID=A0A0S4M3V6_9BURK|nr:MULTISPECIES: integration host factor subunit alpha [Ichthyocystis]CUT17979.1 Integration host factor subunit alpha [Candidatus Ichthyocystis hellenicum]
MTVTKAYLVSLMLQRFNISRHDALEFVNIFFDEIRLSLVRGEEVRLFGFGNFQLRDKPQRPGRNPKTGKEVPISARRVVTFHPSNKLKGLISHCG